MRWVVGEEIRAVRVPLSLEGGEGGPKGNENALSACANREMDL
jgi:hypothetical protein